eukprot:CAMPEP_0119306808 /NCGR_PEP_ID=MMETSP1333-20130426/7476_1 /TAXON_ID=418940 /ORGANISM="Scyphosphaera apsteinii, Strain RCC1455" /LENGTH=60 /DNA_ID=CAMNT_0007310211 /DNA_START=533 /DNA_END=715 /DNA_ORIENTATION=+
MSAELTSIDGSALLNSDKAGSRSGTKGSSTVGATAEYSESDPTMVEMCVGGATRLVEPGS